MTGDGADALGVYISVPFCRSKCTYCNFASGVYPSTEQARYVERVADDLARARAWAGDMGTEIPRRVDTVYLGGGTPSLIEPNLLAQLFGTLRAEFDLDASAEITVECAPGQLPDETIETLAGSGVNRVSLGVQSFVESEARASGRLHNRATIESDVQRLRAAGIANLSIDLIAGLAGQTMASWQESLEALVEFGVPHASVYMLEVDEDSRLGRELLAGGKRYRAGLVPNDDSIACMYEGAIERFDQAGLRQYEISNFSRLGSESQHNLRYWQRRPYLGVGLDASSMLRRDPTLRSKKTRRSAASPDLVVRTTTTDDFRQYVSGTGEMEVVRLERARQFEEAWFLGLRMNAGIDVTEMQREFGSELMARAMRTVERLADNGLVAFDGESVRLTARGRLIANEVFQEFLELDTEPVGRKV
jgi:oxygen-independent coproporphyrinogen III oxidase